MFSNSPKIKDYAKRLPVRHWSFLGPGDEESGTERTTTNLKDNGIPLPMSWYPNSKIADIQSSEHPVRWIEDS